MKTIFGIGLVALFGIGLWQGQAFFQSSDSDTNVADQSKLEHAIKHLDADYVCPMHPSVVSDSPGSCPICGMNLERRQATKEGDSGVVISAAMQRNLGITTTKVGYGPVAEEVYATGAITRVTQAKSTELSSKIKGKIDEIRYEVGDWIKKDAVLFRIDSAEYAKSLNAYIDARENRRHKEMNEYLNQLVAMGADRNVLRGVARLGPPAEQFEMVAPYSGTITKIYVNTGSEVKKGTPLIHIETPKLNEGEFRSFSRKAHFIHEGSKAYIELPLLPGRTWIGRVVDIRHNDTSFFSAAEIHFEGPGESAYQGMYAGAFRIRKAGARVACSR